MKLVAMLAAVLLAADAAPPPAAGSAGTSGIESSPVLRAMRDELERSRAHLELPGEPKPYYLAYTLEDFSQATAVASFGALETNQNLRRRFLRAWVRVGDPKVDNSNFYRSTGLGSGAGIEWVPIEDDYDALRHEIWMATDRAYKDAIENLEAKRGAQKDETETQDESEVANFSTEKPSHVVETGASSATPDSDRLVALARKLSGLFREFSEIQNDRVTIAGSSRLRYFVSTEGSIDCVPDTAIRIDVAASTQADDGMDLDDYVAVAATSLEALPPAAAMESEVRRMAKELVQLRHAPAVDD